IGRWIVIAWVACAAVICLYAVASVIAFGALGGFLTYALIHQVGNVRMLTSSVTAYLTTPVLLTLGAVPFAYIVLVLATRARTRPGLAAVGSDLCRYRSLDRGGPSCLCDRLDHPLRLAHRRQRSVGAGRVVVAGGKHRTPGASLGRLSSRRPHRFRTDRSAEAA